jgi:hypothetical protein
MTQQSIEWELRLDVFDNPVMAIDRVEYNLNYRASRLLTDTTGEYKQGIFSDGQVYFCRGDAHNVNITFEKHLATIKNLGTLEELQEEIISRIKQVDNAFAGLSKTGPEPSIKELEVIHNLNGTFYVNPKGLPPMSSEDLSYSLTGFCSVTAHGIFNQNLSEAVFQDQATGLKFRVVFGEGWGKEAGASAAQVLSQLRLRIAMVQDAFNRSYATAGFKWYPTPADDQDYATEVYH